ncbi:MAG: hypothetical protein ACQETQ_04710 [Spirochaetota bacterium]
MSVIEALKARNPEHVIDVEEDFDPYKQHYRYYVRVNDRRLSILYTKQELSHHVITQHSGEMIYTALVTYIENGLGIRLR